MNFFPDEKFSYKKYYNFLNIKWLSNICFVKQNRNYRHYFKTTNVARQLFNQYFLKINFKKLHKFLKDQQPPHAFFIFLRNKDLLNKKFRKNSQKRLFILYQKLYSFIFQFLLPSCGFFITRKNGDILITGSSRFIIFLFC